MTGYLILLTEVHVKREVGGYILIRKIKGHKRLYAK